MRFGVPQSKPASPGIRLKDRRRSGYGLKDLPSSSDESDRDSSSSSEIESEASESSSDSFMYRGKYGVPSRVPRARTSSLSPTQRNHMEDTVAAIRLRVRHQDPYEEWERKTRIDAFHTARREEAETQSQHHKEQEKLRLQNSKRQADLFAKESETVQAQLSALKIRKQREEQEIMARWQVRERKIWERIDAAIKLEEDRSRVRLEAERKAKEEELKKKKVEEEKRKVEEQRKKEEEERKRKEAEEEKKRNEKEEEDRKKQEEMERVRSEQLMNEAEQRRALGMTFAEDDWKHARATLKQLKAGPMKTVKGNKELKKVWNEQRRKIVPKVGQLTNDAQSIFEISQQIVTFLHPELPREVYYALLSSLSKSILLQAETEVTAEKRSAGPLAQMTINLMSSLEGFTEIFWAKLCQRVGGWPVPISIPPTDVDGPWTDDTRKKAMGYREEEGAADYTMRVTGILRVYFAMMFAQVEQALDRPFATQRYWTYFSRMLGQPSLFASPLSAEILSVALDVGGALAKDIWGTQWIKMLAMVYEGVTTGMTGTGMKIGGDTPDGRAAQVRVQLEVERALRGTS